MQVQDVSAELVTVVVPAYNAARTLNETLLSVRRQTHTDIEVIVVDDGSQDETGAIVLAHAAVDPRVQYVRQPNAGVAAARNTAIRRGRGAFIAPIDADDLWSPTKLELQLAEMRRGGPGVALVYSWFAVINVNDEVTTVAKPELEGDIFADLCFANILGNGSSALMRAAAVAEVGGYDPRGLGKRVQGCEDWELYLLLAERYQVGLVRQALVGYRQTQSNLTSDARQMMRAHDLVLEDLVERRPDMELLAKRGRANTMAYLLRQSLLGHRWKQAAALLVQLYRFDAGAAARCTARLGGMVREALSLGSGGAARTRFSDLTMVPAA